jgi:hypothetical protein
MSMNDEVLSAWARNRIKQLEEENGRLKVEKIRGEPEPQVGEWRVHDAHGQIYLGPDRGWYTIRSFPWAAPGKLSADKQFELRAHMAATLLAGMLSRQGECPDMVEHAVRMSDELLAGLGEIDAATTKLEQ